MRRWFPSSSLSPSQRSTPSSPAPPPPDLSIPARPSRRLLAGVRRSPAHPSTAAAAAVVSTAIDHPPMPPISSAPPAEETLAAVIARAEARQRAYAEEAARAEAERDRLLAARRGARGGDGSGEGDRGAEEAEKARAEAVAGVVAHMLQLRILRRVMEEAGLVGAGASSPGGDVGGRKKEGHAEGDGNDGTFSEMQDNADLWERREGIVGEVAPLRFEYFQGGHDGVLAERETQGRKGKVGRTSDVGSGSFDAGVEGRDGRRGGQPQANVHGGKRSLDASCRGGGGGGDVSGGSRTTVGEEGLEERDIERRVDDARMMAIRSQHEVDAAVETLDDSLNVARGLERRVSQAFVQMAGQDVDALGACTEPRALPGDKETDGRELEQFDAELTSAQQALPVRG